MPKRRKKHPSGGPLLRPGGRTVVDAGGGWVVGGDGKTVEGRCACGEPAVADCEFCGPQCQGCFLRGA
jgi:hypothetical protein